MFIICSGRIPAAVSHFLYHIYARVNHRDGGKTRLMPTIEIMAPVTVCSVTDSPKKIAPKRIPINGTRKLNAFARDKSIRVSTRCHNQKASAVPNRLRPTRLAVNWGVQATARGSSVKAARNVNGTAPIMSCHPIAEDGARVTAMRLIATLPMLTPVAASRTYATPFAVDMLLPEIIPGAATTTMPAKPITRPICARGPSLSCNTANANTAAIKGCAFAITVANPGATNSAAWNMPR
jgi:hypothetical protein